MVWEKNDIEMDRIVPSKETTSLAITNRARSLYEMVASSKVLSLTKMPMVTASTEVETVRATKEILNLVNAMAKDSSDWPMVTHMRVNSRCRDDMALARCCIIRLDRVTKASG